MQPAAFGAQICGAYTPEPTGPPKQQKPAPAEAMHVSAPPSVSKPQLMSPAG
jgi:hypothetical protein